MCAEAISSENRWWIRLKFFPYLNLSGQIFRYGMVGVATSLASIALFHLLCQFMHLHYLIANALTWIIAILISYAGNSALVFEVPVFTDGAVKRFTEFLASRLFTMGLDMALMYLLIGILSLHETMSKALVSAVVIVLNYVLSKFWIFKSTL